MRRAEVIRLSFRALFPALLAVAMGLSAPARAAPVASPQDADTTGMDWSRVPEYLIVPGDVLNLNFGPAAEGPLDVIRTARVRPDGRISVFPVGDVVAAGLTPRDLGSNIVRLLEGEQRHPRVTVEVAEMAANMVHVLGEVRNPSSVAARPFMTAMQAITAAGGFSDDASRNSVLVFHRDGARTVRVSRLRADRVIKTGDMGEDVLVGRFDIVYVPRSTVSNIDLFTHRLFSGPATAMQGAFQGWELFNPDIVFRQPPR
jgi:protein involved in polysaccharide export with SLBB domain